MTSSCHIQIKRLARYIVLVSITATEIFILIFQIMPVYRGVIDKRDMNTPIQFQIWNRNVKCKVFAIMSF